MSAPRTILLPVLRILPERTPLISSSLLCGHRCFGVKRVLAAVTGCNASVLFSLPVRCQHCSQSIMSHFADTSSANASYMSPLGSNTSGKEWGTEKEG